MVLENGLIVLEIESCLSSKSDTQETSKSLGHGQVLGGILMYECHQGNIKESND